MVAMSVLKEPLRISLFAGCVLAHHLNSLGVSEEPWTEKKLHSSGRFIP